jgi:hypothetical protein
MMQCQKSLTLCWRSFLEGSSHSVCTIFAHKGGKYYNYGLMPLHSPVIIQIVSAEIGDAMLTLISMTGQGGCGLPYSLLSRPILLLWMDATLQQGDCWIDITIHYWHSVATHLWTHLRDILTVNGCATIVQKMHSASIGSQYTVSMEYHLNPRSSRHLSFWATTIGIIHMINEVGSLRFNPFDQQFTVERAMRLF